MCIDTSAILDKINKIELDLVDFAKRFWLFAQNFFEIKRLFVNTFEAK